MHEPAIGTDPLAGLCAAALEVLRQPIIICDQDRILFANSAAAQMLRAESALELVGLPLNDVLHPDMHVASEIRRRLIFESRQQLLGLPSKLYGRDGSIVTTIVDARPIEFEGEVALLYTGGPARVQELRS